jgi:hypothetical protein
VPESGLAKNRLKQYLDSSSSSNSKPSQNLVGGDMPVEELQGKAKSLLAKWKSIENLKDDKELSPVHTNLEEENLPQSGHAKNLLSKWQNNIESSNNSSAGRKGPRPITPPPQEELEKFAKLIQENDDQDSSKNQKCSTEEELALLRGHAKHTLAKLVN